MTTKTGLRFVAYVGELLVQRQARTGHVGTTEPLPRPGDEGERRRSAAHPLPGHVGQQRGKAGRTDAARLRELALDCYRLAWILGERSDRPLQVLDVGAHVGAFATNLASARPDVRIECYEPSPQSADHLRRNVNRNSLDDRVRVHELVLAGEAGTMLLDDNSDAGVHNGLVREDHRLVDGDDSPGAHSAVAVKASTFDLAVADSPAPFDVVKVDCEGGEYDLVYRSAKDNWASVQRVVMEYHPVAGESWAELSEWFAAVGLTVVRHEPNGAGLGTAWLSRTGGKKPACA